MVEKKHFDEIDMAKGIGIFLVVIGHCFPDVSTSEGISIPLFRLIHDVIYTFHMPLMFMLGGFLSLRILNLNSIKLRGEYIWNRFLRLMIPYFAVGLIYMPVKLLLSKYANQGYNIKNFWQILFGENPDGGLWYLWALFVIQACLSLFLTKKNLILSLIFSIVCSLVILFFHLSFFRLDDAVYYMFFVILGIYIGLMYENFDKLFNSISIFFVLTLFIVSCYFVIEKEYIILKFLCGVFGSLFIILLCKYKTMVYSIHGGGYNYIEKSFIYLGQHTMDIYIMHGIIMVAIRILLWSILKVNYYICTILMLICGLLLPIAISIFIVRKNKILFFLILGERTQKKDI